jgi:hypothetical protein
MKTFTHWRMSHIIFWYSCHLFMQLKHAEIQARRREGQSISCYVKDRADVVAHVVVQGIARPCPENWVNAKLNWHLLSILRKLAMAACSQLNMSLWFYLLHSKNHWLRRGYNSQLSQENSRELEIIWNLRGRHGNVEVASLDPRNTWLNPINPIGSSWHKQSRVQDSPGVWQGGKNTNCTNGLHQFLNDLYTVVDTGWYGYDGLRKSWGTPTTCINNRQ